MVRSLFHIAHPDPNIQRRGQTIVLVALVLSALMLCSIPVIVVRPDRLPSLVGVGAGVITVVVAWLLARRGHVVAAGWALVLIVTVAAGLTSLLRGEVASSLFFLALPIVIASMVLRAWEVWPIVAATLAVVGFNVAVTPPDLLNTPEALELLLNVTMALVTLGVISFIGAQIMERAFAGLTLAQAERHHAAAELEQANCRLEAEVSARTAELRGALTAMEARAAEKQALLDEVALQRETIREMSVPVLPVNARTLVMPLVGALDSARLHELQAQALAAIERTHARMLLLDITGVPVVDTHVAQGLLRVIQATRLLGAEPLLVGVRPEVAQTMVSLGVDLGGVRTAASLESALGA